MPVFATPSSETMQCAYCGLNEMKYLALCNAENCRKWFCNGTRDKLQKSHIIAHCVKAKHYSVSIFRGFPPETSKRKMQSADFVIKYCLYQPKCSGCDNYSNILDLAVEDPAEPFNAKKTWCRREHGVVYDKVGKDVWNPLVAIHPEDGIHEGCDRVASWLLPVVPGDIMDKNSQRSYDLWDLGGLKGRQIDLLESFWRVTPKGTKADFIVHKRAHKAHSKELAGSAFSNQQEYGKCWTDLVKALSKQEEGSIASLPRMRGLATRRINDSDIEVTVPEGIFTPFLKVGRPIMVSRVQSGTPNQIWEHDASISSFRLEGNSQIVLVHCLSPITERWQPGDRDLEFRQPFNDMCYWRMNQALYKIANDRMCVAPQILDKLLESPFDNHFLSDENPNAQGTIDDRTVNRQFQHGSRKLHIEYEGHSKPEFRDFLFPSMVSVPVHLVRPLNDKQCEAVQMALDNPVCLVQGPPGTGKTHTAAAIVINFARDTGGKVLVCAPSNVAVDHLTLKIAEMNEFFDDLRGSTKLLRLFAHTRDQQSMHEGARKFTVMDRLRRERTGVLQTQKAISTFEVQCIREARIVCCTCNTAGVSSLEGVRFPYLLIDEAVQALEPECQIAITRACEKLVLFGNPKQLGPVVRFHPLQHSQLMTSLYQRLQKKGTCPSVMLTEQYRMHPRIYKMVSQITYNGKLVPHPAINITNPTPASSLLEDIFAYVTKPKIPMVFVDLTHNDELSSNGMSFVNMTEAHIIARLVANILHEGNPKIPRSASRVEPRNIGIITFYNGQRPQLRLDLKFHPNIGDNIAESIEINSVDGFQGKEKEIIILSCVRSAKAYDPRRTLGFTEDPHRLNVAMSRARKALIVAGNRSIYQQSKVWSKYFGYIPHISVRELCCKLLPIPCRTTCNAPPCRICPDCRYSEPPTDVT